ncbi:hypothetical protein SAMN05216460_0018 [Streptococcus sp. 45]|uniref:Uncharacterized protein n=1 Tax=Streptococcus equinus TaxID=1335 RepID=A0A1H0MVW6_STREI|nr:hypothetical protein SAMN05216347_102491 [Streptococcus equinus]SEI37139.1 hypothetical protein SAMN05216460_0018 [Streptococcus sp. 45]
MNREHLPIGTVVRVMFYNISKKYQKCRLRIFKIISFV